MKYTAPRSTITPEELAFMREFRPDLAQVYAELAPRSARAASPARCARARRLVAEMTRSIAGPRIEPLNPTIFAIGPIGQRDANGRGVFADDIEAVLDRYPRAKSIDVIINSRGGLVVEARRIYNLLRSRSARISVRVTGWCASAATLILLAGSHREAVEDARLLIHAVAGSPVDIGGGRWTAKTHARVAEGLHADDRDLAAFYSKVTGRSAAFFEAEMKKERVVTPADAMEWGHARSRPRPVRRILLHALAASAGRVGHGRHAEALITRLGS
jgi:ATP-dependent protease ClpP protease subunit